MKRRTDKKNVSPNSEPKNEKCYTKRTSACIGDDLQRPMLHANRWYGLEFSLLGDDDCGVACKHLQK